MAVVPDFFRGDVTFEDVTFRYPSRDVDVLRGVTFTAPRGATTALVGASGSGKSTCFHLLEHEYQPCSGRVRIDGVDVSAIDHAWLHEAVRLVGQEPVLFSGSVLDNILYGVPQAIRERMPSQRRRNLAQVGGWVGGRGG